MTSAQLDARCSRAKKQQADPLPAFSFQLRAGRSPRGFTLLEVMVALCILAIVLLSVYRLHSQTISMSIESRFYTQAPLLARSALTRWEEARKPEMISDQGDFGKEFPGYQWKISVEDAPSPYLGVQFVRDMRRIDVRVTLNNGERSYEFRTYRFNRE
jgi:prepilin-type N-terminal cleavage/methylation domain-containing protein